MTHHIRNYLIAGLLVLLPLWATWQVIGFLVGLLDGSLALLPRAYQPDHLIGFHVPGLGVILSVAIVFITGLVATNFFGKRLLNLGETVVDKIPLVRTIYNAVKQVSETLFSDKGTSFRNVLLIEYPRKGLWSIAFQTGSVDEGLAEHMEDDMLMIFVPTTPNPTSGFLMMVPKKDTVDLKMSIDEALKMIISLGVMHPKLEGRSEA